MLSSLEFQNHCEELRKFLHQQYDDISLCDVLINTSDGRQLHAHRVVLAAFSEFFNKHIKLNHGRDSSMVFNVEHNYSCMKSLLDFMYSGRLNFDEEEKVQLYSAAVVLNITSAQMLLLQSYSIKSLSNSKYRYYATDTTNHSMESDSSQHTSLDLQNGNEPKIKIKIKNLRKNLKPKRRISKTEHITTLEGNALQQKKGKLALNTDRIKEENHDDTVYACEVRNFGNNLDTEQEEGNDVDDVRSDPDYVLPTIIKSPKIRNRKLKSHSKKLELTKKKSKSKVQNKELSCKIFIPCSFDKCSCHLCGKTFKSHNSRKRHLALQHGDFGIKSYLSQIILKKCLMVQNLELCYFKKRNSQEKLVFQCNKCSKKFPYYNTICSHLKKVHFPKLWRRRNVSRSLRDFISAKKKFYSAELKNIIINSVLNRKAKQKKKGKSQCHLCFSYLSCDQQLSNHLIKIHKLSVEEAAAKTGYPKYKKINNDNSAESIQCLQCLEIFSSLKDLNAHRRQSHRSKDEVPPCGECGNTFLSLRRLKNHLRLKHHKSVTEINESLGVAVACEVDGCNFSSPSAAVVNIHVQESHAGIDEYTCSDCGYSCYVKSLLDKHYVTTHVNREKYLKVKCEICDKRFSKKHHCKLHEYSKHGIQHPSVKIFRCDFEGCDYVCISKQSLKSHELKHSDEKKFECHFCGARLKTKTTYHKHINKIHLGIRPHLCQVCGATFGDNSELTAHINNRHSTEKMFQCDYCPYSTSNKNTFYTHLFMVHKVRAQDDKRKEYRCTLCDFVTPLKGRYRTHMNGHKNIREHLCTECGKQFISSSTLVAHKQWTHSSKMYSCGQCEYRTKTVQKLNEHVRVQHQLRGLKPYRCPYCEFSCATGGNCRKHIKQKHKDEEVRYIRDDALIAAARIARQAGNVAPLLGNDIPIDTSFSTESSTVVVGDDDSEQMMFQLPAYGLDLGYK